MKTTKKLFTVLLAFAMVLGLLPATAFAEDQFLTLTELRETYGAITVEAYNIGQGFLVEPSLYAKKDGKSTGNITVDFLASKNINYSGSTSYFSGFEFDDTIAPQYPDYLEPYLGELETKGDGDGYLAEFDYSQYAGWCYTINDWWASLGADSSVPGKEITDYNTGEKVVLGDIIRWHFTVYGYGADCGFPSNVMAEFMGGNLFTQEDKSELLFILASINDYYGNLTTDTVYETALAVAADPLASAEDIAEQEAILASYIEETFLKESEQPVLSKEFKIYHTLNLESGISLTYAVPKTVLAGFDMETVYMECSMNIYEGNLATGTKTVTLLPTEAGNYYYFIMDELTAMKMNDRLTAVLYGTKDGQPYYSATDDYAIADYAYSMLNNASAEATIKTLCADLLRYGAAAQSYKGYRTDAYADSAMTDTHRALLSDLDAVTFGNVNKKLSDLEDPEVIWLGKTLSLESKVTVKYVLDLSNYEGARSDLSLRLSYTDIEGNPKETLLTELEAYDAARNWYSFSFDGLLAAELRSVISVQVYAGDTPVSVTLQYSPDTYGNGQSGALGALCKALFAYSDSAKAYFLN